MRKKIANGEISPEAYYKDQVRERETYISKGLIPPNERRSFMNQPKPPLFANPPSLLPPMNTPINTSFAPPMVPPMGAPLTSHFYRIGFYRLGRLISGNLGP